MEKSGEIMADLFGDDMKTDETENWQKQKKTGSRPVLMLAEENLAALTDGPEAVSTAEVPCVIIFHIPDMCA